MKSEDHHIQKKQYSKPRIEYLALDRCLSLAMSSAKPPDEPDPGETLPDWEDAPPNPGGYSSGNKPDYGKDSYKTENPFGGSRPNY